MASSDPRVDALFAKLNTGAKVSRFFGQASDPLWLRPAVARGLFQRPPKAVQEGEALRFVGWPQGEYLARVAARADPADVLAAVKSVSTTDDVVIYPNLIRARRGGGASHRTGQELDRCSTCRTIHVQ